MALILEPGQTTALFTGPGSIKEINGLPAGVKPQPALPYDFGSGENLLLVASQTPTFGTFTLEYTVVFLDPNGGSDPGDPDPGDPRPPGWKGPWPPKPKPGKPPETFRPDLIVRPPSSEFMMDVDPATLTVEQSGASIEVIKIDRTGSIYKSPVTVVASTEADLPIGPATMTFPGKDTLESGSFTINAESGAQLGGNHKITFTATGNVSPPGQPVNQKTESQSVPVTVVPWGDFDITFSTSSLTLYRGDNAQVDYNISKKGSLDSPNLQVFLRFDNLPKGVTEQGNPYGYTFFTLSAGTDAQLGSFTITVEASAYFNGAIKTHTYQLSLTVADGFTMAIKAASPNIVRGGPGVTVTVTVQRIGTFTGEVDVTLNLPYGFSALPDSKAVIAPGRSSYDFTVSASCGAGLGTAQVWPSSVGLVGGAVLCSFLVIDGDFSLAITPGSVTLVKGGPGQNLTAVVKPGPCYTQFSQPVTVSFALPPGVSTTPPGLYFAPGTTQQSFTLTADKDAPTGSAQLAATASTSMVMDGADVHGRVTCNLDLKDPTYCYAFSLDSFDIRNTRSLHNDTDIVYASLQIDDRKLPVFAKQMGDVNNGHHPVNLVINPAIAIGPGSKVVFSYVILNEGANTTELTVLQDVLDELADIAGDSINAILDAYGQPSVLGSAVADILKMLISLGTCNCDGVVALDTISFTGGNLASLTQNGTYSEHLEYPGNLDPNSDAYKQIYNSNAGCGSNSDYFVNWSIYRCALPNTPALGTDRNPCLAASLQKDEPYAVFLVDEYGWVWEKAFRTGNGWQNFINLGAPPKDVAAGSACAAAATSGYLGVFVVGMGGDLFELHQNDESSWSWIDHGSPIGEQAVPSPGVVTGAGGYTGVFVVSEQGHLWELPFLNGWHDWKPHFAPDNTIIATGGLSAITDLSGQTRVFVIARDGNLYQFRSGQTYWWNHGHPSGSSLAGSPSFVTAPSGYIGGLVLGSDRHIYELSSPDNGTTFTWKDLGAPPHTSGDITLVGLGSGSPSLAAASDGYVGALVVGNNGGLSELYRGNDKSWSWVYIGWPPPGTAPVAQSDPSYAATPSGYRGAFLSGGNGHLYELYHTGTNHDWAWKDHGA